MIRKHLAGPLQHVEASGYTRLELACAYLTLAYHARRLDQPEEKAGFALSLLSHVAKKRIELDLKRSTRKKAWFH
jgi:hypothetical protein